MVSPTPSLGCQWLTPKRVAWVLNISERALRDWNLRRVIPFSKFEDVIRYDPKDVLAYIQRCRRSARGLVQTPAGGESAGLADTDWQRIERLIQSSVEAMADGRFQMAKEAA